MTSEPLDVNVWCSEMQIMKLVEQDHPFFKPLWRRVAIILMIAAWLAFELIYTRDTLWITAAGAMLAYGIWTFLLKWPKTP